MWGTLSIKTEYLHDGKQMGADFFEVVARGSVRSVDFEAFKLGVTARVISWEVYTREKGLATFGTFAEFARYISITKIDYLFVYDGIHIFSFFDWEMRANYYERSIKEDQFTENGQYKKVTCNAFTELSGELGQRYSYTIWTRAKRTRADGGDRHAHTHGTDLYAFKNFFNRGIDATANALDVPNAGAECETLYKIIEKFNAACVELTGRPFLEKKKPVAMTAGGLAKRELLRAMYGHDSHALNVKAFKRAHPMTRGQDLYLCQRHIMRGGICYSEPKFEGKAINDPVYKYDVSSEYTAVAVDMPDLGKIEECPVREFFAPCTDYVYFAVFSRFHATARRGMPALIAHPNTGAHPRTFNYYEEIIFFKEEIDALAPFYVFGECVISHVFRVKKSENRGYKRFGEKFYDVKETARKNGKKALGEFAKLMLNSAWGKLAERDDYPVISHEINPVSGQMEIVKTLRKDERKPDEKAGGLSVLQGAYVTMRGRVMLADYILKICGSKSARDTLIYTDTDSVMTLSRAPVEIVKSGVLGAMKDESDGGYLQTKVLGKKVYYNVKTFSPLSVEMHCRGVPAASIVEAIEENYGDKFENVPADALGAAFTGGVPYPCPILANVTGGRACLYMNRTLFESSVTNKGQGKQYASDNGALIEI